MTLRPSVRSDVSPASLLCLGLVDFEPPPLSIRELYLSFHAQDNEFNCGGTHHPPSVEAGKNARSYYSHLAQSHVGEPMACTSARGTRADDVERGLCSGTMHARSDFQLPLFSEVLYVLNGRGKNAKSSIAFACIVNKALAAVRTQERSSAGVGVGVCAWSSYLRSRMKNQFEKCNCGHAGHVGASKPLGKYDPRLFGLIDASLTSRERLPRHLRVCLTNSRHQRAASI
ncbi:hypothetical protein C8R45DRAFT_1166353 [Mycena sanguinolenta]|nr:hypothetical protein C8R45DRAFT_1166353 [Mycena sanguinolenta]